MFLISIPFRLLLLLIIVSDMAISIDSNIYNINKLVNNHLITESNFHITITITGCHTIIITIIVV